MSTTGVNICSITNAGLEGATVGAAGALLTMNPKDAKQQEAVSKLTRLDYFLADLSAAGYAKNGGLSVALTGTTPVNLSLIDLTSNSTFSAGDTVFATWNQLVFKNTGAADVTIAPGGSNPANLGLGGTTPTLTVPAGSTVTFQSVAGLSIDGTHKIVTVTPTAGGSFALCVGGA
jgi:hypothetical protein